MTAEFVPGRLAQVRSRRGWTLQTLSTQVGLDVAYLSRLECGIKANPSLETLARLARICGTTISFLAGLPEEELVLVRPGETAYPGMKERIRWARQEQRLAQSAVARACHLTPSYLSQLESGAKVNPTMRQLLGLATALKASLPYLVGELPDVSPAAPQASRMAGRTFLRFVQYQSGLPARERQEIRDGTVELRFRTATTFLLNTYPSVYTPVVVAFQLGLSLESLRAVLELQCDLRGVLLDAMARLTGLSPRFFATGDLTERDG